MSQAAIMMQADQKLFDLVRKSENEKNLTREISSLNDSVNKFHIELLILIFPISPALSLKGILCSQST